MFEQTPDILTFKECQELLKIGKNTLLDLLHNEEIEGLKSAHAGKFLKLQCWNIFIINIKKCADVSMCQNFFTFSPFCIN